MAEDLGVNITEEELFTDAEDLAEDLDQDAKVIADDILWLGYTLIEFVLICVGLCFGLCLICFGVCSCACISRKKKNVKAKVNEVPKDKQESDISKDGSPGHTRVPTES